MSDDPEDAPDWSQVAQHHYEPDGTNELTTAIVYAVAEAEGVSPSELESPLYESVDVPAIENAFFGSAVGGGPRRGAGTIEFRHVGYLVAVHSDGWVRVYASGDGA